MKGKASEPKRKPKRLNRREIGKLVDRASLGKHKLDYEKVGESPKGFDFHIDQPSWRDRLAWRVRSIVHRLLKLEQPGRRDSSSKRRSV